MYWLLLELVFLHVLTYQSSSCCPFGCDCESLLGLKTLFCTGSKSKRKNYLSQTDNGTQLLVLQKNHLSEIPVNISHRFPLLQRIDFSNNKISKIPSKAFSGLKRLNFVTITNNNLVSMGSKLFQGTESVEVTLKMGNNKLININKKAFRGFHGDTKLDLSNNKLTTLPSELFHGVSLLILNLANNRLEALPNSLFTNQIKLFFIELQSNRLSNLNASTFSTATALETLDLSSNNLSDLPRDIFEFNTRLKKLNLDDNLFLYPPLKSLPKSVSISMHGNPIRCDCNLKELLFAYNRTDFDELICNNETIPVEKKMKAINCSSPIITSPRPIVNSTFAPDVNHSYSYSSTTASSPSSTPFSTHLSIVSEIRSEEVYNEGCLHNSISLLFLFSVLTAYWCYSI